MATLDTVADLRSPSHRGYPLVMGVVRRSTDSPAVDFFDQVRGARRLISTKRLEVRAIGPVLQVPIEVLSFTWGMPFHTSGTPDTWRVASEAHGSAGIFQENDRWVLFTDSTGIHPVYMREHDGDLFFATRLAPLVSLGGSLHIDWEAWASTLTLGAPIGTATHFTEIRRLDAATGLRVEREGQTRIVSYEPTWLDPPPGGPDLGRLAEALREALPPPYSRRSPPVSLSGGWDSRLIAALAKDKYRRLPRAWTTDPDTGWDTDVRYASEVAQTLHLRHRVIMPTKSNWPEDAAETRERLEYQTWSHPWLAPLCRQMRRREREVLDGFIGGLLLRASNVDPAMLSIPIEDRVDGLYTQLGVKERLFAPHFRHGVGSAILGYARDPFRAVASRFSAHLNHLSLVFSVTRNARVIALSPLLLFGPELKTWLPFLHPEVMREALAIDPRQKVTGDVYRTLLLLAAPSLARLPSTNDIVKDPSTRSPRRQGGAEATTWMTESILTSEAASSLVEPDLRGKMAEDPAAWTDGTWSKSRFAQSLSLFAQWEHKHRDRLVDTDPPW